VWSSWLAKNKEVQKKAVNMVIGLRGSTYEEKLEELNMLTMLEARRHQGDIIVQF
jgi:hypothetical protein